jgi:lipopolysaccharide transport system ATP-binding protein
LNGAILGMTKAEIREKEEEIIEFSGCQLYVDTPVKRYSSGMRVRLAFAVAAHLEPDILVVDEVLAVGDAEFQKKAIGKMKDISSNDGRTVLFVSHNMAAVKSLCTRGIVLENGTSVFEGTAEESVDYYLSASADNLDFELKDRKDRTGNGKVRLRDVKLFNKQNIEVDSVISGEFLRIKLFFEVNKEPEKKLVFAMSFKDQNEIVKSMIVSDEIGVNINSLIERGYLEVDIEKLLLRGGLYSITILIAEGSTGDSDHLDRIDNAFIVDVLPGDFYKIGRVNRKKPSSIIPCEIR